MKKWRDRRKQVTVVSNNYRDTSSSDENIEVNDSTSMNVDADSPLENGMFVNNENTCDDVDSDLGLDLDDSVGPDLGTGVGLGLGAGVGSGPGSSDSSSESGLDTSSSESDSDCLNDENDDDALCERLKTWALNNNCTRDCINEILAIVSDLGGDVPKDSRTLLETQRDVIQTPMGVGHYIYIGVEKKNTKAFIIP